MLNSLLDWLDSVPPVPRAFLMAEPLEAAPLLAVPPVPPKKTKTQNKKQKILNWLAHIGETDPEIIEDTLARCRADREVMAYFLKRASESTHD